MEAILFVARECASKLRAGYDCQALLEESSSAQHAYAMDSD